MNKRYVLLLAAFLGITLMQAQTLSQARELFNQGKYAEALLIASCGPTELFQRTRERYIRHDNSTLTRVISYISADKLESFVRYAKTKDWREIFAILCNYAKDDFEKQVSGAVWLNDEGRKKVLARWQEKKRSDMMHPYLKQKIPMGLLPYVQSNLLAKYVRGDMEAYPSFLLK